MKSLRLIVVSKQNNIDLIDSNYTLTVDYEYPYNDYEVDGEGFGLEWVIESL